MDGECEWSSYVHILNLFYAWFLGNWETVSFFFSKKKKNCFFVELLSTLHIYRSAAEIIYDPDTTNDDPWELPIWHYHPFMNYYAVNKFILSTENILVNFYPKLAPRLRDTQSLSKSWVSPWILFFFQFFSFFLFFFCVKKDNLETLHY